MPISLGTNLLLRTIPNYWPIWVTLLTELLNLLLQNIMVIPKFDTKNIPDYDKFENDINSLLASYIDNMENVNLRKGLELAMAISSRGNQFCKITS